MRLEKEIIAGAKFKCEYVLPFTPSNKVCMFLDMICCIFYLTIFYDVTSSIMFIRGHLFVCDKEKFNSLFVICMLALIATRLFNVYKNTSEVTCIADLNVSNNYLMLKYDKFNSSTLYIFDNVQRGNIKVINANNFIITGKPELLIAENGSLSGKKFEEEIHMHIRVDNSKEVIDEIIL